MNNECPDKQLTIKIKFIDDQDNCCQRAILADANDLGITVLTPLPLPLNTHIAIKVADGFVALSEVADWEWDVMGDMARTHLRILEKNSGWPG